MKKFITFLLCTSLITSAFAQAGHRNRGETYAKRISENDQNRNKRRDWKYDNNNSVYQNNRYSVYQRNRLIEKVNREYNFKIQRVNHDRRLSRREKKRIIKSLQAQRVSEIRRINAGYENTVYNNRNKRDNNYNQNRNHKTYPY